MREADSLGVNPTVASDEDLQDEHLFMLLERQALDMTLKRYHVLSRDNRDHLGSLINAQGQVRDIREKTSLQRMRTANDGHSTSHSHRY